MFKNAKLTLEQRVDRLECLLFNEAKQVGTLYHVCPIEAYLKYIYPTNTLQASGTFNNKLYKGREWVSFTRDQHFVIYVGSKHNVLIQLVVDGDKLSENYKIGPYNYYAFPFSNRDLYGGMEDEYGDLAYSEEDNEAGAVYDDPTNRQQEEVVKGPIKNISKYIKEIRFCFVGGVNQDTINFLEKCKSQLSDCVYAPFVQNGTVYRTSNTIISQKEFLKLLHKGDSVDDVINCYNSYMQKRNARLNNFKTLGKAIRGFNYKEVDELLRDDDVKEYFQNHGDEILQDLVSSYIRAFNQDNGKCSNPDIVSTFKSILDNNVDVTKFRYRDCYSTRPCDVFNALPRYGGFYIKSGNESEVATMIRNI